METFGGVTLLDTSSIIMQIVLKWSKLRGGIEQRYSMEPKGFEMNQSKGTFLKNQIFFSKICRSSLAPDGYTIGQVRLYKRTIYV